MAGQGRWPFVTAWFRPGTPAPVYKSFLWGDRDDAEVVAFTDWYFEAGGGGVSGTSATTNANDTPSASGTTAVRGTSATTNASDTSSASGTTAVRGTLARTNANDTSSASGSVGGSISGTSATTNANDAPTASGWAGRITGTVARTNANDTPNASGWAGVVSGTSATTNANDIPGSTTVSASTGAVFYFSLRLVSGVYESGVTSTANRGSDAWIPAPRIPIGRVQPDGFVVVAPEWRRFFDTMADRLGGVQGPRLPDVATAVETTQATVQQTTATVSAVAQQSQAIAEAVTVITEVNQNAALAGADQIPPVPRGLDQFIP